MGNWENQYIQQVRDHSSFILEEEKEGFSDLALRTFAEKKSQFKEIYLEIGSGSGMHIIELAKRFPEALCVGIELRYKRTFRTIEKGLSKDLNNLFMIRGAAHRAIELFEPNELSKLFVHYPDPWEKKRWRKHRLLQEPLLSRFLNTLKVSGEFSFRTDHREYFSEVISLLSSHQEKVRPIVDIVWQSEDLFSSEYSPEAPTSEFESLFFSKNIPLSGCIVRRLS